VVCLTGQHREMLHQVLDTFDLDWQHDLNLMRPDQDLFDITLGVMRGVGEVLADQRPDVALVHGDTTTTFAGALACFYAGVPVGHVEAGLRTNDKHQPFPEEINRRLGDAICDIYFAPTAATAANLRAEGYAADRILVTGNTVIDALLGILPKARTRPPTIEGLERVDWSRKTVLVTCHRRESFGAQLEGIAGVLRRICEEIEGVNVVLPMHRNPRVRGTLTRVLSEVPSCFLIEPQDYLPFVWLMDRAHVVLTDSGGVQEEAPSLDKPVLVLRNKTERTEAVATGAVKLTGTDPRQIFQHVQRLLTDPACYWEMAQAPNPYGDGKAAIRIANALHRNYRPQDSE